MVLIWTFRVLVFALGPAIGYFQAGSQAGSHLQGALFGLLISAIVLAIELSLSQVPLAQIVLGLLGAVLGIIAGGLLDFVVDQLGQAGVREFWSDFSLLTKILLAYLGLVLVVKKFPELDAVDDKIFSAWSKKRGQNTLVLDTSALIDGRICDVIKTKFITSETLIAAQFILEELQHLSDDQDGQRRARGRRGLDMLAKIQEDGLVPVRILETDYPDVKETDQKLIRLAKDLKARLVTTDYNLYKVSNIQGVEVLNMNDLAQALKPVVLPGETFHVYLIKEGKERDQGVGYLDDGTMVVVEGAKNLIGKRVEVHVSSILQTSAGKMVFSRPKNHHQ
ncbi:MAG: TRAM domain-containing protein [Elusimicrobia bacterium]|nr:TRAM domain-containing protein [Elusimicrobiota bacterium]